MNMKKLLLSSTLLLFFHFAHAQVPVVLNAFVGTSNVIVSENRQNFGFCYGGGLTTYLRLPIKSAGLFLEPSADYLLTGYTSTSSVYKVRVNYGIGSLLLMYSIDPRWRLKRGEDEMTLLIGGGPYLGMATKGKFNYDVDLDFRTMTFGDGLTDNRAKYDGGLALKAGIGFSGGTMSIQRNYGLRNVMPGERVAQSGNIFTRNFMAQVSFLLF